MEWTTSYNKNVCSSLFPPYSLTSKNKLFFFICRGQAKHRERGWSNCFRYFSLFTFLKIHLFCVTVRSSIFFLGSMFSNRMVESTSSRMPPSTNAKENKINVRYFRIPWIIIDIVYEDLNTRFLSFSLFRSHRIVSHVNAGIEINGGDLRKEDRSKRCDGERKKRKRPKRTKWNFLISLLEAFYPVASKTICFASSFSSLSFFLLLDASHFLFAFTKRHFQHRHTFIESTETNNEKKKNETFIQSRNFWIFYFSSLSSLLYSLDAHLWFAFVLCSGQKWFCTLCIRVEEFLLVAIV